MQQLVRFLTLYLAAGVEVGAAVIVGFAAGEAMVQAVSGLVKGEREALPREEIRLRLARWLALAIEFELAADIIRTMVGPTWNEIGQLAAIIVNQDDAEFLPRPRDRWRRPAIGNEPCRFDEARTMKLKIGVMGSATEELPQRSRAAAFALGKAIAQADCFLVTGGCPGLPLESARGAKRVGGFVLGISPGLSEDEHVRKYASPTDCHDVLVFTGSGLMGREVVNIRSSDIVVIVGGSSGTLGELAIAYDEGKLIGVLTGTGGVIDMAEEILAACKRPTGARVIYDIDPENLVKELLEVYRTEHYRKPSCFCDEAGPSTIARRERAARSAKAASCRARAE